MSAATVSSPTDKITYRDLYERWEAGNWSASPGNDAKITLAIQDDGRFAWAATSPGKPATTIAGGSTLADGVLTLAAQGTQDGALTGEVAWQDPDHFTFRLVGSPPTDPGLTFAR